MRLTTLQMTGLSRLRSKRRFDLNLISYKLRHYVVNLKHPDALLLQFNDVSAVHSVPGEAGHIVDGSPLDLVRSHGFILLVACQRHLGNHDLEANTAAVN